MYMSGDLYNWYCDNTNRAQFQLMSIANIRKSHISWLAVYQYGQKTLAISKYVTTNEQTEYIPQRNIFGITPFSC